MFFSIVLAFILGGLCGGLMIYFFNDGSSSSDKDKEIDSLRDEHQRYREKVDAHFVETADLFKDLTDRYRDVYKHMAAGADNLCSEEVKQLQADMRNSGLLIEAESESTAETGKEATSDLNVEEVLEEAHEAQTEFGDEESEAVTAEAEQTVDEDDPTVIITDDTVTLAAESEAPRSSTEETTRQIH